jgi:hypothetical protein
MGTVVALILISQAGMNGSAAAINFPAFQDDSPAAQAAYEERALTQRYNGLARALNDFMAAYKAGKIDLKKAEAVRKALHDLEKFEWFRPQRPSAGAAADVEK